MGSPARQPPTHWSSARNSDGGLVGQSIDAGNDTDASHDLSVQILPYRPRVGWAKIHAEFCNAQGASKLTFPPSAFLSRAPASRRATRFDCCPDSFASALGGSRLHRGPALGAAQAQAANRLARVFFHLGACVLAVAKPASAPMQGTAIWCERHSSATPLRHTPLWHTRARRLRQHAYLGGQPRHAALGRATLHEAPESTACRTPAGSSRFRQAQPGTQWQQQGASAFPERPRCRLGRHEIDEIFAKSWVAPHLSSHGPSRCKTRGMCRADMPLAPRGRPSFRSCWRTFATAWRCGQHSATAALQRSGMSHTYLRSHSVCLRALRREDMLRAF